MPGSPNCSARSRRCSPTPRSNLAGSQAHDLWAYGDRAFAEQADVLAKLEAGTLMMRDLGGKRKPAWTARRPRSRRRSRKPASQASEFAALGQGRGAQAHGPVRRRQGQLRLVAQARHASAPGPTTSRSSLLQRELDRSLASLRLEEVRNRAAPPIARNRRPRRISPHGRSAGRRSSTDCWVDTGTIADRPYYHAALPARAANYVPPADRNFFSHVTALDPLPLSSHEFHWIELARLRHEPQPSPIRDTPPLFNIYADRSEGFATAMEEIVMQAGLYDDIPHGRELVWVMLANRAARGLASLRVQANEIDLDEAGQIPRRLELRAAGRTRRASWSASNSCCICASPAMVRATSSARRSSTICSRAPHTAPTSRSGRSTTAQTFAAIFASGIVPPWLIEDESAEVASER